jgi:hypothetical protein
MPRITTDPIGMQPTASIPFGYMADLELGSDKRFNKNRVKTDGYTFI